MVVICNIYIYIYISLLLLLHSFYIAHFLILKLLRALYIITVKTSHDGNLTTFEVVTLTWPLGTLVSVVPCRQQPSYNKIQIIQNHKTCNILSTDIYITLYMVLLECLKLPHTNRKFAMGKWKSSLLPGS